MYTSHRPMSFSLAVFLLMVGSNWSAAGATPNTTTVDLLSSVVMDSGCFRVAVDSSDTRRCRTVEFSVSGNMFVAVTEATRYDYQHVLMQPVDAAGSRQPFGLVAQWKDVGGAAEVTSNGTHLTIALPVNVGLVLTDPAVLRFAFRQSFFESAEPLLSEASQHLSVAITATPATGAPVRSLAVQGLAAVGAALALPLPIDPVILDVQLAVLIGSSPCIQAMPRATATAGRRLVFPSIFVTDPVWRGLWHNLVIIALVSALHALLTYALEQRYACDFSKAAAKMYFPALSFAIWLLLAAGVSSAGLQLLLDPDPDAAVMPRVASALAVLLLIFPSCVVPAVPAVAHHVIHAVPRSHHNQLIEFPSVLRYIGPSMSWGPSVASQSWAVPFGAMRTRFLRFACAHLTCVVVTTIVLAVTPESPQGCAGQLFFVMVVLLAYSGFVLVTRPFRSPVLSILASANAALLAVPVGASFAHCFDPTGDTGTGVTDMFSAVYAVCIVRVVLNAASHGLDVRFLKPLVWPDGEVGMVNGIPPAAVEEAGRYTENALPRQERSEAYLEELRALHAHVDEEAQRQRQRDQLHQLPPTERRAVLGEPEPLPARVVLLAQRNNEEMAQLVASRERSHHGGDPMSQLVAGKGPMPPALHEGLSADYRRL